MEDSSSSSKTTPQKLLEDIVNNVNLPWQMRIDASKALLPYTAKRNPTEASHLHTHTIVTDERLRLLDDGELRDLIKLVQKLTFSKRAPNGGEAKEV